MSDTNHHWLARPVPEKLYPEINVISSERRVLARVEKSCGLPKNTRSLHSALE